MMNVPVRYLVFFPLVSLILAFCVDCNAASNTKQQDIKSTTPTTLGLEPAQTSTKKVTKQKSSVPGIEKKITLFCCDKGVIKSKTGVSSDLEASESCYSTRMEAERYCGYCCLDGVRTEISSKREFLLCKKKRGQFITGREKCLKKLRC